MLVWHDLDHLQVGDTKFSLALDFDTCAQTQSTVDDFLLIKNWWLVQSTIERLPEKIENMVELGIYKGGSIALYEELYSPKRLVGVDLKDRVDALDEFVEQRSAADRIKLYYGTDQQDRTALERIVRENFDGELLDVVIDDGSHRYEPSKASLNVFLPLLRTGGIYLIEDWAWAQWPGAYFQEDAATGQYADEQNPLTKLVLEAVMLCASRPGIISDVYIEASRAFLTRGHEPVDDPDFDISTAYLTSLWKMEYERSRNSRGARADVDAIGLQIPGGNRSRPIDIWRSRVPLSVRKKVPPTFAERVRKTVNL
jgi:hypothetical protein